MTIKPWCWSPRKPSDVTVMQLIWLQRHTQTSLVVRAFITTLEKAPSLRAQIDCMCRVVLFVSRHQDTFEMHDDTRRTFDDMSSSLTPPHTSSRHKKESEEAGQRKEQKRDCWVAFARMMSCNGNGKMIRRIGQAILNHHHSKVRRPLCCCHDCCCCWCWWRWQWGGNGDVWREEGEVIDDDCSSLQMHTSQAMKRHLSSTIRSEMSRYALGYILSIM